MQRPHRVFARAAGAAAGWLLLAACSEAGTATQPLPNSASPALLPAPNGPNSDLRMSPAVLNPAYQIDDNGVVPNGISGRDSEEHTMRVDAPDHARSAGDAGPADPPEGNGPESPSAAAASGATSAEAIPTEEPPAEP